MLRRSGVHLFFTSKKRKRKCTRRLLGSYRSSIKSRNRLNILQLLKGEFAMAEGLEISPMEIIHELTTSKLSMLENGRLENAMARGDSVNSQLFWNALEDSSVWLEYTKKKHVDGFRPNSTSKQKKRQLSSLLKQSFEKSKATKTHWGLYFSVCMEHIRKQYPALQDLLEEDISDVDSQLFSETLMRFLCESAASAKVYRNQIAEMYELLPIRPAEDFASLLSEVPEYGLQNEIEDKIQKLHALVDEVKADQNIRLDSLRERLGAIDERITEDQAALGIRQTQFEQSVEGKITTLMSGLEDKLSEDLGNWQRVMEELHASTRQEYEHEVADAQLQRDLLLQEFQETVLKVDSDLQELVKDVDYRFADEKEPTLASYPSTESQVYDQGWLWNHLRQGSRGDEIFPQHSLDEEKFLDVFVSKAALRELSYPRSYLECFHRAVVGMQVIVVSDADLMNCWIDSLNWHSFNWQLCASPIWSDPSIWASSQRKLLSNGDNPCILSVLDFDKGLVSCYLEPVLKIWMSAGEFDPAKKVFLVQSDRAEEVDDSTLTVPVLYMNRYRPSVQNDGSRKKQKFENAVLDPKAFRSWSRRFSDGAPDFKLDPTLRDRIATTNSLPIMLTIAANELLANLRKGGSKEQSEEICMQTLIQPWLERESRY